MKKYLVILIISIFFTEGHSQNFIDSTFAYNGVNYKVHSEIDIMGIYNAANSQNITAKVLSRTRKMNYQQLKVTIVNAIKSLLTPAQLINIQSENIMINLLVDNNGKINVVYLFYLNYNTCLQPADIYNIEVALKNITMQFMDGLPPEAGQLGSVGIPAKMFR